MATETVTIPQEHAGIGAALRAAFMARSSNTPDDFVRLLDTLD